MPRKNESSKSIYTSNTDGIDTAMSLAIKKVFPQAGALDEVPQIESSITDKPSREKVTNNKDQKKDTSRPGIPPELRKIFDTSPIPNRTLSTYNILKSDKKKKDYLAYLQQKQDEKQREEVLHKAFRDKIVNSKNPKIATKNEQSLVENISKVREKIEEGFKFKEIINSLAHEGWSYEDRLRILVDATISLKKGRWIEDRSKSQKIPVDASHAHSQYGRKSDIRKVQKEIDKLSAPVQIETKPGTAWEQPKDTTPLGREMPRHTVINEGPLTQVETKKPSVSFPEPHAGELTAEELSFNLPEDIFGARDQVQTKPTVVETNTTPSEEEGESPSTTSPQRVLEIEEGEMGDDRREPIISDRNLGNEGSAWWGWTTDETLDQEMTPRESRSLLKSLIGGYTKTIEGVKWWKSSEEKLIRRSAELDKKAENIGGLENKFRKWGETYNKMPLKYKIAIGASLGLGAVLTSGTLVSALPLLGIAGQRVAGLSTMYLKFEKASLEKNKKSGKVGAFLKASGYTVLLGLTMHEAVAYASQTEIAQSAQAKIQTWLGNILGHHSEPVQHTGPKPIEAPKAPPSSSPPDPTKAPSTSTTETPMSKSNGAGVVAEKPTTTVATGEAAKSAPMVDIEVKATKGHGYEYMVKRLWEGLQEAQVTLSPNVDPASDLAKLLAADKDSIDDVVHKLAQENKFFKGTGDSVRIGLDSRMTIDSNGNILFDDKALTDESTNIAPEDADITPSHKETPSHNAVPEKEIVEKNYTSEPFISPTETVPAPGTPPSEVGPTRSVATVDASPHSHNPVVTGAAHSPESTQQVLFQNQYGVKIPVHEPHMYKVPGLNSPVAYGGQTAERVVAMKSYLLANPREVIIAADETGKFRVVWHLDPVKGMVHDGPIPKTGFFANFFGKTYLSAPEPREFTQLIK
jgi:hypothetical protein